MVSRLMFDRDGGGGPDMWPRTADELAASIAHEANQPLAAIVTHGCACLNWLAQGEAQHEKARASVAAMTDSALHLSGIIRALCALATKAEPKAMFDLNEVVERSLPLKAEEMSRNSVCLELVLTPEPLLVCGDVEQLRQVMLNLVSNGIQAMAPIQDRHRLLRVRSQRLNKHAVVTIEDEGPGLTDESVGRLFNGFYTTKPGGMGVGLTLCRSIVDAHGGTIWASSNPELGASFNFALPAIGNEEEPIAPAESAAEVKSICRHQDVEASTPGARVPYEGLLRSYQRINCRENPRQYPDRKRVCFSE